MVMGMMVIVLAVEITPNQNKNDIKIQKNPDFCSAIRSELIGINERLDSKTPVTQGNAIWILSDSRSSIQYLSISRRVTDSFGVTILEKLK